MPVVGLGRIVEEVPEHARVLPERGDLEHCVGPLAPLGLESLERALDLVLARHLEEADCVAHPDLLEAAEGPAEPRPVRGVLVQLVDLLLREPEDLHGGEVLSCRAASGG